ncbi:MAG: glutamine--fructose-6-phosphate transaminase (isomerizing), partial [Acidobacteriota bacterium]
MCGIFGIVVERDRPLGEILTDAGRRLSYRGYDSVGCAVLSDGTGIDLRKDVGKVDDVAHKQRFAEMAGRRGMVQLRWATFGAPSRLNAQPHLDSDGQMVGAHNGNVVNNVELRRQFIAEGMKVRSTNDGESCVHAVERYINRGYDFIEAIRRAYADLEGDYAFVITHRDEHKLYAIKKGSGLVAGLGEGLTCVSSDLPSILPITRRIVRIHDGEVVVLTPEKVELYGVHDGARIERAEDWYDGPIEVAEKGGYPHFML